MNQLILKSPQCVMKEFNNLFIELTAKNCNQRCKYCYIDFPLNKNVRDFIAVDKIKQALFDTKNENIKCIYLTGAEPMTHPDFNLILRNCLKFSNVCICTNGSFINEKKARFIKKVEDECSNEIIFELSINHYNEIKNDEVRSRGSYRITMNAIKNLIKYDFNPIICITNFYNEPKDVLITEFKNIFSKFGFEANDNNFIINTYHGLNIENKFSETEKCRFDCEYGRILTSKGIYTCPFLANDHRGRCGSTFADYSKHNALETPYCSTCLKNKEMMFSIDYELFR